MFKFFKKCFESLITRIYHKIHSTSQSIIDQSLYVVWEVDLDFNYTKISKGMMQYGWEHHELIGRNSTINLTHKSIDIIYNALKKYKEKPGLYSQQTLILECLKKDGSLYYIEVQVNASFDKKGFHVGFCGISRDVTKRLEMEKLKEENIRLKSKMEICGGVCHNGSQMSQSLDGALTLLQMDPNDEKYWRIATESSSRLMEFFQKLHIMTQTNEYKVAPYLNTSIIDLSD